MRFVIKEFPPQKDELEELATRIEEALRPHLEIRDMSADENAGTISFEVPGFPENEEHVMSILATVFEGTWARFAVPGFLGGFEFIIG